MLLCYCACPPQYCLGRAVHHELGFEMKSVGAASPLPPFFNASGNLAGRNGALAEGGELPADTQPERINEPFSWRDFDEGTLNNCAGAAPEPSPAHLTK